MLNNLFLRLQVYGSNLFFIYNFLLIVSFTLFGNGQRKDLIDFNTTEKGTKK